MQENSPVDNSLKKSADPSILWTLFKTCFTVSACTFGGGMVIISMLQKKFVEKLGWIRQDEVMDLAAIAQTCPGVMAVNTSIMIGFHVAGFFGALLAVLGTVLPPIMILTVISSCYAQFRSNRIISLLLHGMQAGVAAVMLDVTITMIRGTLKDRAGFSLALLTFSSAAVLIFHVDIIPVLIVCGTAGGLDTLWQRMKTKCEVKPS